MHLDNSDSGLENSKAELCRRYRLPRVVTPNELDDFPSPEMDGIVKSSASVEIGGTEKSSSLKKEESSRFGVVEIVIFWSLTPNWLSSATIEEVLLLLPPPNELSMRELKKKEEYKNIFKYLSSRTWQRSNFQIFSYIKKSDVLPYVMSQIGQRFIQVFLRETFCGLTPSASGCGRGISLQRTWLCPSRSIRLLNEKISWISEKVK